MPDFKFARRVTLTLALLSSAVVYSSASEAAFARLAVLGDSLSDQGRFYEITDIPFLGGLPPSSTYFNGRFSNGPVWVDYFKAENPTVPVFNRSMGGALAGTYAGIDNVGDLDFASIPIFGNGLLNAAIGLRSQVLSVPNVQGVDIAFGLLIGANDFLSAPELGFPSALDILPSVVTNMKLALKGLIKRGANHFVLFNLPDLGRTPEAVNQGRVSDLSQATLLFNQQIDQLVTLGTAAGFTIDFIDTYSLFEEIAGDPVAFGFTNITTGCLSGILDSTLCGNPNEARLFWDTLHPTTAGHALFADLFSQATGFSETTFSAAVVPLPASAWLLFAAFGGLTLFDRYRARRHV